MKCTNGMFSIRQGTVLDHSKLPIQTVLRIMWNVLHGLSEQQCKDFCDIGKKK